MTTQDKTKKKKLNSPAPEKKKAKKRTRTYKGAGVDIQSGNEFVKRIAPLVRKTFNSKVVTDIGGFSGLYNFPQENYNKPVLVSSTDGVGTKLKIAFMTGIHDTIGIDLVAMCVNDILAQGAKPLFFLDYLAMGKLDPDQAVQILEGIVEGCQQAGCALIGGETAELPDFYKPGEYDLAGFAVGVVDKDKIIDSTEVRVGNKIIGLGSNGLHSNGYSLVRKIIFDDLGMKLNDKIEGTKVQDELLKPTRIYVNIAHIILRDFKVTGIAHITGGGLIDNLPRILPKTCQAVLNKNSWQKLPIFDFLQQEGGIAEKEMYRTFNMGLGLVVIVPASEADEILERLAGMDEPAYLIGEVTERKNKQEPLKLV